MINRDDMLELTRRMTPKRNCFTRIAGAYLDEDGLIDGTFNIHFQKLSASEIERNLNLAKTIPFSAANENLKAYTFPSDHPNSDGMWRMLMALTQCGLKNDAMLENLYELIGETAWTNQPYYVYLFHGSYDVPGKAKDKAYLYDSDLVYHFLICLLGPQTGEYEPGTPQWGFLFPVFSNRAPDTTQIAVYNRKPEAPLTKLLSNVLFLVDSGDGSL